MEVGDIRFDNRGMITLIGFSQSGKWLMVRRNRAVPFVLYHTEWDELPKDEQQP